MFRTVVAKASCWALSLSLLALSAQAAPGRTGDGRTGDGDPEAIHLPFRGYGITSSFQLVKVFGNDTQYTVWPYADLSGLPWNAAMTASNDGGLASDPWNWRYLYVSVPIDWTLTKLYRFDLTTNTISSIAQFPGYNTQSGWNGVLQGLGARCASKFANLNGGGVGFYSHRRTHPVHVNYVHEITSTGAESVGIGPMDIFHGGDNTEDLFQGAHWFTYTTYDGGGNTSWGVKTLKGGPVPMGHLNDGGHPTGILAYGSGSYYVSVAGAEMYRVATGTGASVQLSYIPWGVPAYPTAPEIIDLSNPSNFCSVVLP